METLILPSTVGVVRSNGTLPYIMTFPEVILFYGLILTLKI